MSTFKLLPGLGVTVVLLRIADALSCAFSCATSYASSYASSSGATPAPTSEQ